MSEIDGHQTAFLVMYPTGAVSQSFLPDTDTIAEPNKKKAEAHAKAIEGLVVLLPVMADFRTGPLRSAYEGELVVRVLNTDTNINTVPEPPVGSVVEITSGRRIGRTHDHLPGRTGESARRWYCSTDSVWRSWMQVQQDIGDASWEIK